MSILTSVSIENPYGQTQTCARFEIPNAEECFTLEGVTVAGVQYTLCLWVSSEAEGLLELPGGSVTTSAQWKRYAATFTAEGPDLTLRFGTGGIYYLCRMKLEVGTKATDYTPAPEDMASEKDIDAINEAFLSVHESIAAVDVKADGILASVSQVKKSTDEALSSVDTGMKALERSVAAKLSAEAVELEIRKAMESGTSKVVTTTGFTLNENGLSVEKSGREMRTQITEDGMTVYQNGSEVLAANSQGVDAKNLHATTYLTVGGRSRFENYGSGRTGCFWIGGS